MNTDLFIAFHSLNEAFTEVNDLLKQMKDCMHRKTVKKIGYQLAVAGTVLCNRLKDEEPEFGMVIKGDDLVFQVSRNTGVNRNVCEAVVREACELLGIGYGDEDEDEDDDEDEEDDD